MTSLSINCDVITSLTNYMTGLHLLVLPTELVAGVPFREFKNKATQTELRELPGCPEVIFSKFGGVKI